MMQDGLHIGLAAWIHQQQSRTQFVVYPPAPVQIDLVELEAIRDVHDLAKAAEFARLVNFIPRQGQIADTFNEASVLWRRHWEILSKMDHATQPWTSKEQEAYQLARDTLYTASKAGEPPQPSEALLFYNEMREAYEDIARSGGSTDDLALALSNWVVLGYKQVVEEAFEVLARLTARSSRTQANNEALALNADPPGVALRFYGDSEFAATYFAPVSAIDRATWLAATVSFADLDAAAGVNSANGRWKAFLAGRSGEVQFNYAVLRLLRPWLNPLIYQADDWKLGDPAEIVSKGDGAQGLLPGYVNAVYLVCVTNIVTGPKPPPPTPLIPVIHTRPILQLTRIAQIAPQKALAPAATAKGPVPGTTGHANEMLARPPGPILNRPTPPLTAPGASALRGKSGFIRTLNKTDLALRQSAVRAYVDRKPGWPPVPSGPATPDRIYVTGFGCERMPVAPNPNPAYQW